MERDTESQTFELDDERLRSIGLLTTHGSLVELSVFFILAQVGGLGVERAKALAGNWTLSQMQASVLRIVKNQNPPEGLVPWLREIEHWANARNRIVHAVWTLEDEPQITHLRHFMEYQPLTADEIKKVARQGLEIATRGFRFFAVLMAADGHGELLAEVLADESQEPRKE